MLDLLFSVSAALVSFSRMDSISTSYACKEVLGLHPPQPSRVHVRTVPEYITISITKVVSSALRCAVHTESCAVNTCTLVENWPLTHPLALQDGPILAAPLVVNLPIRFQNAGQAAFGTLNFTHIVSHSQLAREEM